MSQSNLAEAVDDNVIILADGTRIRPDGTIDGEIVAPVKRLPKIARNEHLTDKPFFVRQRKFIGDLPAPPKTMNAINVVLMYTMFGLGDDQIAEATGLRGGQVADLRTSEAYMQMQNAMVKAVAECEQGSVRSIISQYAIDAAHKIGELSQSENAAISLHASKDILDRAGHRPADVVQHNMMMDQVLRIEIIEKTRTEPDHQLIDITPGE